MVSGPEQQQQGPNFGRFDVVQLCLLIEFLVEGQLLSHHAKVENEKVAGWRFWLELKLINKATVSKFILISSVAEPVKQKLLKGSRAEIICFINTGTYWLDWRLPWWIRYKLISTTIETYRYLLCDCCVAELFFPGSALDFFFGSGFGKKNFGSGSTQKISTPTGSDEQIVKICLHSAPDFDRRHVKNLNFNIKNFNKFVPTSGKP